jgi:hypothetical protein
MSHGRDHDARGVKGTFRKGTQPTKQVLNAIPDALGTVGNLPNTARPGNPESTVAREAKQIMGNRRAVVMDEGVPVLPGGNRDTTLATSRPAPETVSPDKVEAKAKPVETPAPEPVAAPAPPEPAPEPVAVEDEVSEDAAAEQTLSTPLPSSKRKLVRAKLSALREWCEALDIVPEEYVNEDEDVTGDLMRVLVGDKLNIDHGIELPEEEPDEEVDED